MKLPENPEEEEKAQRDKKPFEDFVVGLNATELGERLEEKLNEIWTAEHCCFFDKLYHMNVATFELMEKNRPIGKADLVAIGYGCYKKCKMVLEKIGVEEECPEANVLLRLSEYTKPGTMTIEKIRGMFNFTAYEMLTLEKYGVLDVRCNKDCEVMFMEDNRYDKMYQKFLEEPPIVVDV